MTSVTTRVLVAAAFVICAVGSLDALISREWDLAILFIAACSVHVMLYVRQGARRRAISIRPDLAQWLEHRAQVGGDTPEDVLDRAVATFKHGLYADEYPD